ncbi:unnamed protein product [Arabidopsis halleri]
MIRLETVIHVHSFANCSYLHLISDQTILYWRHE